jgi:tripartite-type tricarboxylate transporter receptor subunit TctC
MSRVLSSLLCVVLGAAFIPAACAQTYPSRPVRIVVGFLPGGSTDIMVRLVTPALTEAFHQQFVIDNRPGANSNIGNEAVAKAPPDGYTLLGVSASFSINVSLYPKMGYDPVRDFAPITRIAAVHNVLVVHPSLPVKSVKELVALIKAKPGQLVFASSGSGSTSHLAMELLKTTVGGLDAVHVPYKSGPPALVDLVSGQVQMLIATMPSTLPYVQGGRLRALAVASLKRAQAMPNVPTFIESGYPGFEVSAWNAMLAPAGTPPEIINRLNAVIVKAVQSPDLREKFASQGAEPVGDSPEQFGAYLKAEVAKWAKVIKASGATLD